jgi:MHS family alpha-ketoglutarate permease-like MFS transporter
MPAGSVVLALAPTERAVGAWAAVILVVVSLLQGIATGGEYAAATVLLSESGTRSHRGFFASFQATTIVGGLRRSVPEGEQLPVVGEASVRE